MLKRIFPFLGWFESFDGPTLRADLIAGVTVAMVLIPQSMAYAQLAGLPPYYGLYAAFIPPMVAALFGSSRQLQTGPVAVVSLMTAASLEPLATAGSEGYIAYAVMLALMVGVFQFALGVFRLGVAVNFLSHPVVLGFTNAAAIIIATSQLSKLFGVYVDKAEHHYETIWRVVVSALEYTHWPTLLMGILSITIMVVLKRVNPKIPSVLAAVAVCTLISFFTGFQRDEYVTFSKIESDAVRQTLADFNEATRNIAKYGEERAKLAPKIVETEKTYGAHSLEALKLHHESRLLALRLADLKEETASYRKELRTLHFRATREASGNIERLYLAGEVPAGVEDDGVRWRLKVGNRALEEGRLRLIGGGAIVAEIPAGLPKIKAPTIDFAMILQLLPATIIISLLGFMEAISIAKAMAAKTGQRLDPTQELIGQGLANICGSFGQSYAASGSFSRSAVNIQAGALTGLSSVVTSMVVGLTLMFFTPLLYHLPQSVLASIIMMAVIGLVDIPGLVHTWQTHKHDGITAIASFVCTLAFAPHLDKGIMIGVVLSLIFYLYRNMKPKVSLLALHPDASYRYVDRHGLRQCKHIAMIRFDGSLFFANTSYLEDQVLERVAAMPELRHVLVVSNGINWIDASGEEGLSRLVDRIRDAGYEISFSGLNDEVLDVMRRTHLYDKIGEENIFPTQSIAINSIHARAHEGSDEMECPLTVVIFDDRDGRESAQ